MILRKTALFLLVFTLGVIVGMFFKKEVWTQKSTFWKTSSTSIQKSSNYHKTNENGNKKKENHFLVMLSKRLELDEDQQNKIQILLDKSKEEFTIIRRSIKPEIEKTFTKLNSDIESLLNEEQTIEFKKMQKEFKENKNKTRK